MLVFGCSILGMVQSMLIVMIGEATEFVLCDHVRCMLLVSVLVWEVHQGSIRASGCPHLG